METVYITDNVTVTLLHTTHETSVGSEFAVLHEVRLGWHDSVNYPLSDSGDRKHFEQLLTRTIGLDCYATEAEAEADLVNWYEGFEVQHD